MLKEGDEAVAYPRIYRRLLLGIVFALGIGLQLYRLTFVTLWSDEFRGTLQLISFPWSTLVTGNYSWELNPPLYFLSLKAWVTVFGTTETVMRLFSILLHSGSLVTIYALGQKIGNWKAGLAAMSVLAFHPVYMTYATQLRMYPLLILLTLLAFLCFFSYTLHATHHSAWLLGLGLSLTLALYTHYFGVFAILGIGILSTLYLVLTGDTYQRYVLLLTAGIVILCVPVFWLAFQQSLQYAHKALDQTYPHLSVPAILEMFSGSMTIDVALTRMIQLISILSVLGGVVVLVQNNKKVLALSLVSFIGTASVLAMVLSARYLNVASRHLLHVYLMAWLVSSLALLPSRDTLSRYLKLLTIAAILINAVGGVSSTLQQSYHSPNWKHIAHVMRQAARPEEPIVIMGWDAAPTSYYLHAEWLNSYDFEKHVHEQHAASYLILDSPYSRKLPFVDLEANVIYTDAHWKVKVVRYIPSST
ncbi:MAG: glycosyltransferase family 39 protein [Chloroflexi bacterium]|nr:glycosyltransferase family 39 protein [Chloroflexota bacterium]